MNKQVKTTLITASISFLVFGLFLFLAVPDNEWPSKNLNEWGIYMTLILGVPAFFGVLAYYFSSVANRDAIANKDRATKLSNLDKSYSQTIAQNSQKIAITSKNDGKKMMVPLLFVAGFFTYFVQLIIKKYSALNNSYILFIFITFYIVFFVFYVIKYEKKYEVNAHTFIIVTNYWFISFRKTYQLASISNFKRVIVDHMQNGVYAYSDRYFHFDYESKKIEVKTSVNNEGYNLLADSIAQNIQM